MNRLSTFVEIAGTAVVISPKTTTTDVSADLSCREVEILMSVASELTNEEVGTRLDLGYHAVRAHLRRIYKKLGVKRRTEAVKRFFDFPPVTVL